MTTDTDLLSQMKLVMGSALAAGILLIAMVAITLIDGTGFNNFESLSVFGTPALFASHIVDAGATLRKIYPLDTMYIFAYTVMVFALLQIKPHGMFSVLSIIAVLGTGILDFVENNHIIAMLLAAENGSVPSVGEITFQTVVTQTKFNFGLLLTLSFSFILPFTGRLAVFFRWFARGLVLIAPIALLTPLTTFMYICANLCLFVFIAILAFGRVRSAT